MNKNYILPKKKNYKRLSITEFNLPLPNLKNTSEIKSAIIGKWIIQCIKHGFENNSISVGNRIPPKTEFAYKLGVSLGTIQGAFRYVEDLGYTASKQCIGTMITDPGDPNMKMYKLTSTRRLAAEAIKRYIKTEGLEVGMSLPSLKKFAKLINYNPNTLRIALDSLSARGILEHTLRNQKLYGWTVKTTEFDVDNNTKSETLVYMVAKDIEDYIYNNLDVGDRIPSHPQLAYNLKVGLKTIHDALKILSDKGILQTLRGKYGTVVKKKHENDGLTSSKPERSIFAPAKDTAFYVYEKIQNSIKKMIAEEYDIGERFLSVIEISKMFDHSPNTVRRAFHNLAKEGYLAFSRGRYGGTFVIDIPETELQSFKWLAVDPKYVVEKQEIH